jgi:uncharacterized protein DUF4019
VGEHMDAMGLMTLTARGSVTVAIAAVVVPAVFLTPRGADAQQQKANTPAASATGPADSAPEVAAQREAERWLRLVDQGQYETSWDSSSATFRRAVARGAWGQMVLQARSRYEPLGARRLLSRQYTTVLPKAPPGQYVVLQYQTAAAGGHQVVETVVMERDGDHWRLSGYFIRPA